MPDQIPGPGKQERYFVTVFPGEWFTRDLLMLFDLIAIRPSFGYRQNPVGKAEFRSAVFANHVVR